MNDRFRELIATLATIVLLVCSLLLAAQRDALKVEAVKRGYAQWIVSPEGETAFKWKSDL